MSIKGKLYSRSIRFSGIKYRPASDGQKWNPLDAPRPPRRFWREMGVETIRVGRRTLWHLNPKKANGWCVFYLHGGSYAHTFEPAHWQYAGHLAEEGYNVYLPDYPLLPEGNVRLSFDFAFRSWLRVLQAFPPERIVVMGDSAGGGFALGFMQELKVQGWQQPARGILLSPWLDVSMSNPDIYTVDRFDPFLGVEKLKEYGKRYASELGVTFPWVSPIYGNFEGLAPLDVYMGSHDVLCADARKLYAVAVQKGLNINYHEAPDMIHVYMLFDFPESRTARASIDATLLSLRESTTDEVSTAEQEGEEIP